MSRLATISRRNLIMPWKMLALAVLLLGFGNHALAGVIWNLNATFTDGMTASGVFVTDDSMDFTSWDVFFAGGTLAHDFESSSATLPPGAIGVEIPGFPTFPDQVEELFFAKEPGFDPYVDFYLGSLLTDAGGAIPLVGAFSCDGTCYELNSNDSNTLVGTAVPEPSTIVLTVPILGLLFGALRRRQIHARSAVLAHAGLE
jgi:hypothetical protein